jgi:hypothetical protein
MEKSVDSVHGATGPPWNGSHCCTLTGVWPLAASVPESSDQGAREGKEGPASSTVGSPWVGRWWRAVTLAALGSAMVVMAVELRSEENEMGRTLGQCEAGGVLGHLL